MESTEFELAYLANLAIGNEVSQTEGALWGLACDTQMDQ